MSQGIAHRAVVMLACGPLAGAAVAVVRRIVSMTAGVDGVVTERPRASASPADAFVPFSLELTWCAFGGVLVGLALLAFAVLARREVRLAVTFAMTVAAAAVTFITASSAAGDVAGGAVSPTTLYALVAAEALVAGMLTSRRPAAGPPP